MSKYHLSHGEIKKCQAKDNNCPLGGTHFNNVKEAQKFYEIKIEENLNIPQEIDCDSYIISDYEKRAELFINSLDRSSKNFIKNYVRDEYSHINESLWNDENDYFNSQVNNALLKNNGDPRSLWRIPPQRTIQEIIHNKKIGDTIELKGYSSTSETPRSIMPMMVTNMDRYMDEVDSSEWIIDRTKPFGKQIQLPEEYLRNDPNIVFQFVTSMGGEVSPLSYMEQEKETLLPARTEWKIVGIKKNINFSSSQDMFGNDLYSKKTYCATVYQLMEI